MSVQPHPRERRPLWRRSPAPGSFCSAAAAPARVRAALHARRPARRGRRRADRRAPRPARSPSRPDRRGRGGVTVGSNGRAALRAGTTASLEEPSLSGQANRYVAINPGPHGAGAAGRRGDPLGAPRPPSSSSTSSTTCSTRARATGCATSSAATRRFDGRAADAERVLRDLRPRAAGERPAVPGAGRRRRGARRFVRVGRAAGDDAAREQRRPGGRGRGVRRRGRRVRAGGRAARAGDRADAGHVRRGPPGLRGAAESLPAFDALLDARARRCAACPRSPGR